MCKGLTECNRKGFVITDTKHHEIWEMPIKNTFRRPVITGGIPVHRIGQHGMHIGQVDVGIPELRNDLVDAQGGIGDRKTVRCRRRYGAARP